MILHFVTSERRRSTVLAGEPLEDALHSADHKSSAYYEQMLRCRTRDNPYLEVGRRKVRFRRRKEVNRYDAVHVNRAHKCIELSKSLRPSKYITEVTCQVLSRHAALSSGSRSFMAPSVRHSHTEATYYNDKRPCSRLSLPTRRCQVVATLPA